MGRALKLSLTAALLAVALVAFAFAACGKHGVVQGLSPGSSDAVKTSPEGLDYQGALTELDALACPDGVDAGLWAELKGALEAALACRAATCGPPLGPDSRPLGREIRGAANWSSPLPILEDGGARVPALQKIVSTPPTGEANRVNDLGIADNGDGTFTLSWHYRNLGDYDQNGKVAIADITPLAQHFGETCDPETEPNSIQAVIDGSGNSKVGIEDVTAIAQNFGVDVDHYAIEASDALAGTYVSIDEYMLPGAVGGSRTSLSRDMEGPLTYTFWRVAPVDTEGAHGDSSNIAFPGPGRPSVMMTDPSEGTAFAVGDRTPFAATAEDDYGVTKVEFFISGSLYFTDYEPPWSAPDYTFQKPDYPGKSFMVMAYDIGGQTTTDSCYLTVNHLGWVHTWGGDEEDYAYSVAVDSDGSSLISGWTTSYGAGEEDMFLIKMSPKGALEWQKTWGGSGKEESSAVAIDDEGNMYVAGRTYGFGEGGSDAVLLKYSPAGTLLWQKTWGGTANEQFAALATDGDSCIYAVGETASSGAGDRDVLVVKYSLDGVPQWQKSWGGTGPEIARAVVIGGDGEVYLTGYTWSFASQKEAVLLRFSSTGELHGQTTYSAAPTSVDGYSLALDVNGDIYIGGRNTLESTTDQLVLLKCNSSGELVWRRTLAAEGDDLDISSIVCANTEVYVGGKWNGYGPAGSASVLVAYSLDGTLLKQRVWEGERASNTSALALDTSGILYMTGTGRTPVGVWQIVEAVASTLSVLMRMDEGTVADALGVDTAVEGLDLTPEGALDEGDTHAALVLKLDPTDL